MPPPASSLEFDEPAAAVIKHTNPCGVATGATIAEAYVRAREADSLAAFGGIIGLNRALDEDDRARDRLDVHRSGGRAGCRRCRAGDSRREGQPARRRRRFRARWRDTREYRSILGAMLVQERDRVIEAQRPWPTDGIKVVTKRQPTADEWQAMRFAWRVMAHVKSNTVIFTDAVRTLAIGAGQMSRVDAVKVAVNKAGGWKGGDAPTLKGSVAASDAFFPFRDGLDAVAAAGATAVVQPGGSVKDAEVIAAADEHGLAMVFTGRRHFRHCRPRGRGPISIAGRLSDRQAMAASLAPVTRTSSLTMVTMLGYVSRNCEVGCGLVEICARPVRLPGWPTREAKAGAQNGRRRAAETNFDG